MKKSLVMIAVCLFLLAGCNSKDSSANLPTSTNNNGTTVTESPKSTASDSAASSSKDTNIISQSEPLQRGAMVEIKEKMFIAQTNDIYLNPKDYLGKTIKYEGIFNVYEEPNTGEKYYSVIRYGPGCCGVDANAGFEVVWDKEYSNSNDWVEAVGVLEEYDDNGMKYLRLSLLSLTVKTERGAESVFQ